MKINKRLVILWPTVIAVILGTLIITLVFNLVQFSHKISSYYTPVILASENMLEAATHLEDSLASANFKQASQDMAFVHFQAALTKFKNVLTKDDNIHHYEYHEDEIFKDGEEIITFVNSNSLKKAQLSLSGFSRNSQKHYNTHVRELKTAQNRMRIFSFVIAGLCGIILLLGVYISIRERRALEAAKHEAAIIAAISALINALEAKDPYTKGHSTRVVKYAMVTARGLGMAQQDMDKLELSALMHDIGKIGVPDHVLLKTEKLTDDEFDLIKKHPATGINIIEGSENLQPIVPGILYHHERYDGRGYPDGLKGDEIPICAQCIAIADTFDAMTSTRSYRKALSVDYTLNEIDRCRNKQWSTMVVDSFFQAVEKGTIANIMKEGKTVPLTNHED